MKKCSYYCLVYWRNFKNAHVVRHYFEDFIQKLPEMSLFMDLASGLQMQMQSRMI